MKSKFTLLSILAIVLSVTSCSNPLSGHYTNIQLAFLLNRDATVSIEQVRESQVELALINSGNRPTALIAKAFSEYGKDKWISEDKAMLVIQNSRIIRTVGFKNDQLGIFSGSSDPLADVTLIDGASWERDLDWSIGEYGYPVHSTFVSSTDTISVLDSNFHVLHIIEEVDYLKSNAFFEVKNWNNHYWIDAKSGLLLKTSQQSAPFSDRFEIIFVSNAVKLLDKTGMDS